MSVLRKLFRGKKNVGPTTEKAIQKLLETEDMLIKKQESLENAIEQEIKVAKKNTSTNKRAAIQALKRKKRFEKQLQQIEGKLTTIQLQKDVVEGAHMNTAVSSTMKESAGTLKLAQKELNVHDIRNMMDDIAVQQEFVDDISNAITNPVGFDDYLDEHELEKEFEQLEKEEMNKNVIDVPQPASHYHLFLLEKFKRKRRKKK